jgi:hypothetical protein
MCVIAFHNELESQIPAALEKQIGGFCFAFGLNQESVTRECLNELWAVEIAPALFVTKENGLLMVCMLIENLQGKL